VLEQNCSKPDDYLTENIKIRKITCIWIAIHERLTKA